LTNTPFHERFALLLDSGQVQQRVVDVVTAIIQQIERDYSLLLNEDNAGMFVSHIALALQRLADDKPLEEYPSVVQAEARTMAQQWAYAQKIAAYTAEALGKSLPEGEVGYLTIHLQRLVQEAAP
jgi:transcriptional antiterminator